MEVPGLDSDAIVRNLAKIVQFGISRRIASTDVSKMEELLCREHKFLLRSRQAQCSSALTGWKV